MGTQRQFHSKTFQHSTSTPPIQKKVLTPRPFSDSHTPSPSQDDTPNLQAELDRLRRRPSNLHRITPDIPATIQPKLTVGAPNDVYEQEADRVADQVMSMPESTSVQREMAPEEEEVQTKPLAATITPLVQREAMPEEEDVQTKPLGEIQREEMPAEEEALQTKAFPTPYTLHPTPLLQREAMPEEEKEKLQTKPLQETLQREEAPEEEELQPKSLDSIQREDIAEEEDVQTKSSPTPHTPHPTTSLESRLNSSKGGGSPLPQDVKGFMESRFRTDFSQVRVHTDSEAVQMNRDLNAQAFTHKQDVYFGGGKAPGKDVLTAHELTHVVQQTGAVQTKHNPEQPTVQMKCAACEKEDAEVQRSPNISPISNPGVQKWSLFGDDEGKQEAEGEGSSGGGILDWAKEKAGGAVDTVTQAGSDAYDWAKEKGGAAVDTVTQVGSDAVDWAKEKGGAAVDTVTQAGSDAYDWAKEKGGAAVDTITGDDEALTEMIKQQIVTQVNQQAPQQMGLIDELNNLENYWDDNGIPNNELSYKGLNPDVLDTKIKEQELAIASLESARTSIVKKARADARQSLENTKHDLNTALLGGASIGGILAAVLKGGAAGALSLLVALVGTIVAEHEIWARGRDAVRAILTKAKEDLKVINTNIKIEKKKLEAMKMAAKPINVEDLPDAPLRPEDLPDAN